MNLPRPQQSLLVIAVFALVVLWTTFLYDQRTRISSVIIDVVGSSDDFSGGIGNVRNELLNCLRYSIEAGAALIVPIIIARSQSDLSILVTENISPLSTFFDEKYFLDSLRTGCPQLRLIPEVTPDLTIDNLTSIDPTSLYRSMENVNHVVPKPEAWREYFDEWLTSVLTNSTRSRPSNSTPVLVRVTRQLFVFPTTYDSPIFSRNFGRILKFRSDVRRLAGIVLWRLSKKFNLGLQADSFTDPTGNTHLGAQAHLRTASDATNANYVPYDVQSRDYLEHATAANLSVIYVASGNATDVERFRTMAWDGRSINVTTKIDLLSGNEEDTEDLRVMKALTWDQQALIDWEVLLRARRFAGIWQSSFAWTLSLQRYLQSKIENPYFGPKGQTMDDEFSTLYGPPEGSLFGIPHGFDADC